jgi:hypothetical protein
MFEKFITNQPVALVDIALAAIKNDISPKQARRDDTLDCLFLLYIRRIQPAFGFRRNISTLGHHIPAGQFLQDEILPSCCLRGASGRCSLADKVGHHRLAVSCFRCLK